MSVVAMLGGRDLPDPVVAAWASEATTLYAADSGADRLLALGFRPTVVGDMDSFKGSREGLRIVESADQETSDLDKLLGVVVADGHSKIVVLGLEGDRLDHMLVGLRSLVTSPLEILVVLRRGLGLALNKGSQFVWNEDVGSRFSVICMRPQHLKIMGARWPVDMPDPFAHSLSNVIDPGPLVIDQQEGAVLVIIERDPMRVISW